MTRATVPTIAAGALLLLSACATPGGPAPIVGTPESIEYSVGPCMGFCPVYDVTVKSAGAVTFNGERHTSVLGRRYGSIEPADYRSLAAALAPHRPALGTVLETSCVTRVSDLQHHRIVWTDSAGRKTTLDHDRGCRSPANDALNVVFDSLPGRLRITQWTRQVTRPGAGRG